MKRNIIIIVILFLLTTLCTVEAIYLNSVFNCMTDKTQQIIIEMEKTPEDINTQALNNMTDELIKYWEEKQNGVQIFIPHTQAMYFTDKLASLKAHVLQNDYNMANTCAVLMTACSEAVLEQNTIRFHNIF